MTPAIGPRTSSGTYPPPRPPAAGSPPPAARPAIPQGPTRSSTRPKSCSGSTLPARLTQAHKRTAITTSSAAPLRPQQPRRDTPKIRWFQFSLLNQGGVGALRAPRPRSFCTESSHAWTPPQAGHVRQSGAERLDLGGFVSPAPEEFAPAFGLVASVRGGDESAREVSNASVRAFRPLSSSSSPNAIVPRRLELGRSARSRRAKAIVRCVTVRRWKRPPAHERVALQNARRDHPRNAADKKLEGRLALVRPTEILHHRTTMAMTKDDPLPQLLDHCQKLLRSVIDRVKEWRGRDSPFENTTANVLINVFLRARRGPTRQSSRCSGSAVSASKQRCSTAASGRT